MSSGDVQKAIYHALVAALSVSVYDAVPPNAPYPYVVIGDSQVVPVETLNNSRNREQIYLSVYSDYAGQREVKNILSIIKQTFHRKRLSLDVGRMISMNVPELRSLREPDGKTFMGSAIIEVVYSN